MNWTPCHLQAEVSYRLDYSPSLNPHTISHDSFRASGEGYLETCQTDRRVFSNGPGAAVKLGISTIRGKQLDPTGFPSIKTLEMHGLDWSSNKKIILPARRKPHNVI
ncbi:hypothetical protein V2G26_020347 [Clonostachys chloroleuca]